MKSMLEDMDYPDMICIQEARLKAMDEHQRGEPKPSEYAEVKSIVESVFQDYHKPLWSLADARYAGTVTFLHKRVSLMEQKTGAGGGGPCSQQHQCAFTMEAALQLILQRYQLTRAQTGLSTTGSRPTNTLSSPSHKGGTTKHLSMKSFFAPKTTIPPTGALSSTVSPSSGGSRGSSAVMSSGGTQPHHPEGRFQFFTFPAIDASNICTHQWNQGRVVSETTRVGRGHANVFEGPSNNLGACQGT